MGAWIEIIQRAWIDKIRRVAPYMGAWIEIIGFLVVCQNCDTSHPTWVRGLK